MAMPSKRATTNKVIADIKRIVSEAGSDEFSRFTFRGLSNTDFQLIPSIARNNQFFENESQIIDTTVYRRPDVFSLTSSPIEQLARLQHFGTPTRLLDITRNPLVALYFASASSKTKDEKIEKDGIIYIFKDEVNLTSKISLLNKLGDNGEWCKNDKYAKDFCNNQYVFLEAPLTLERQRSQQGMFILFLNDIIRKETGYCFDRKISPMTKSSASIVGTIVISSRGKKQIRSELESLGISESTLFPENVDYLCDEIKKMYGG